MATTELTKTESRRLSELEEVISRGIETFVEVGHALKEIRDSKLYRQEYSAFEKYCRAKWGWSRAYSYGLIEAGDIAQSLSPIGDISTESQARELSRIKDPKERTEVWTQVIETHEPQEITAKVIRETVESRKPEYIHTETHEVSDAMTLAGLAISQLERIRQDDPHLVDALKKVTKWIVKKRLSLPLSNLTINE